MKKLSRNLCLAAGFTLLLAACQKSTEQVPSPPPSATPPPGQAPEPQGSDHATEAPAAK